MWTQSKLVVKCHILFQTSSEENSLIFKKVWDKFSAQPDYESKQIGYSAKEFQKAFRAARKKKTAIIHYHILETVLALYTTPTGRTIFLYYVPILDFVSFTMCTILFVHF